VLVVHEQSRLARNQLVFQLFLKLCREAGVRLVSIAEGIDTTTPDGEMLMGLLMQFSQHQSRTLARHVAKAKKERVRQGLTNGSLPFGYRRCDCGQGSEGTCRGHAPLVVPDELAAVRQAFARYATGTVTASMVAQLLNEQGFRTRNTRKDPEVGVVGPRPFGKESVVDMLRNPFYAGKVRYKGGELLPGVHEAAVTWELFAQVQQQLNRHARNGATDRTRQTYLLNGLLRCVHCGERLWAVTVKRERSRHGAPIPPRRYARYRTMCHDRGNHDCPSGNTSVSAWEIDEQVSQLIQRVRLPAAWQAAIAGLLATDDERAEVERRRQAAQERLRRAARAYADGNLDEADYERRKRETEAELASLVVPAERELVDAASYLANLGRLWEGVDLPTRREIVLSLFDAIYVDVRGRRVDEYRPKAAFRRLLLSLGGSESGDPDGIRTHDLHRDRVAC
jgi:site-specific DNA recombinase